MASQPHWHNNSFLGFFFLVLMMIDAEIQFDGDS